jgi:hypothetical protein
MRKPEVAIRTWPALVSGARCPIEIEVTAHDETRVDYIRARLVGDQGWAIGSGKSRVAVDLRYLKLETELMGSGVLPAGSVTQFSTAIAVPAATPPTHDIDPAYSRMRLIVHISIPWRIDGRHRHELAVRLPPPPQVVRTPVTLRSTRPGEAPDKPRIELGLGATCLVSGETLVGTCALFHLDDREPRDVELALVPMLTLAGRGRFRERRGAAITTKLTMPAGSAGTGVPFRLHLPRTLTPTFACTTHALAWYLIARTGSFFGPKVDLVVPLQIVDASAAATTAELTGAPRLGDEQVAAELAGVAARRGWRTRRPDRAAADPDADPDAEARAGQLAIERELDGCRLRLAYSYRAEGGTFVVSRIDHPSLGLGLSVTPSSTLRHVLFRDIEIDLAAWDRAHLVTARAEDQTIPVLRAIVPALPRPDHVGTLVRWSDDALVFELAVSAVHRALLEHLATLLEQLAPVIAAAQAAVPPPPGLAVDVAAWRALARELGGTIAIGDLSIDGTFQGAPVEVGLAWDAEGRPASIRAAVGDPEAASAELRATELALARPVADVADAPSARQLVDLVARWPDDWHDLHVADGVASARLRLPAGDPPRADAARARELVAALRAVLVALDPGRGPYR